MQFPLTRFLYSYYQSPPNSNSYLLREIDGNWSATKVIYASCGVIFEFSPYILIISTLAAGLFSNTSHTRSAIPPILKWTCLACMIPGSSYVGSRIALMILKYLRIRSDIKSISDKELSAAVKLYSPSNPLSRERERLLLELTERNLDRRDNQSQLLSMMINMPDDIKKIILSYCEDEFQRDACRWIQQIPPSENANLKDQLLQRCVYAPEHTEYGNIETQIYLIIQFSDKREQVIKLRLLYQFHRNKGNYAEIGGIIKCCFKYIYVLPRDTYRLLLRETGEETSEWPCTQLLQEITQKLKSRGDLSEFTLSAIIEIMTDEECFSDLFFQHFVLKNVNNRDRAALDHVFQTLLSAESSRSDFRRFRNALIEHLFPIGATVFE